jgi:hypothetical protein
VCQVDTGGDNYQPPKTLKSEDKMEKRQHLRIEMENLSVDVADGVGFFRGKVSDVSRFGVCIADLPKRLNGDATKMTIVISGRGGHFKMDVRPRWYTHGGVMKSVGVEIIDATPNWREFVTNIEPALQKEVWNEIRL